MQYNQLRVSNGKVRTIGDVDATVVWFMSKLAERNRLRSERVSVVNKLKNQTTHFAFDIQSGACAFGE